MKTYDKPELELSYQVIPVGEKYKVALEEDFDSEESARKFCMDMGIECDDTTEDDAVKMEDDTPEALKPTPESMAKMMKRDKLIGKQGSIAVIVR